MIQTFHIQIPVTGPADEAVDTITKSLETLMRRHPALLGATIKMASEGLLELVLRCTGRDRWKVQGAARTIASMALRRARLDPAAATVVLVQSAPDGRSLTKEQGRPERPRTPRATAP